MSAWNFSGENLCCCCWGCCAHTTTADSRNRPFTTSFFIIVFNVFLIVRRQTGIDVLIVEHHVVGGLIEEGIIRLLLLDHSLGHSLLVGPRRIGPCQPDGGTHKQGAHAGSGVEHGTHPDSLGTGTAVRQRLHHLIGQLLEIAFGNHERIPLAYQFFYVLFFFHRIYDVIIFKWFNRVY